MAHTSGFLSLLGFGRHSGKGASPYARSAWTRRSKRMRDTMSEHEINKTVEDSFPASDLPGNY